MGPKKLIDMSFEVNCRWLLKDVFLLGLFILPNQFDFHPKYLEKIYFLRLIKNLHQIAYLCQRKK